MPDPTYANDLVLCNTFIAHSGLARMAEVTYAIDDATRNASAQQWADDAQSLFADNLKSRLDTDASIVKTLTLKGDGTSTFTTGESTAAPTNGTGAFSSVPANTAILVKKVTGVGGRRNRGRCYFPWMLNEGTVDEIGNIDPSWVSDTQAKMDDWLDALAGGDSNGMVIANRTYDLPWNDPRRVLVSVEMGPVVTALVVESIAATQRRRMPRS
jgi:hypothetical protein